MKVPTDSWVQIILANPKETQSTPHSHYIQGPDTNPPPRLPYMSSHQNGLDKILNPTLEWN